MLQISRKFGISATTLRVIAMTAMLLDHICHGLLPKVLWLNCVGRIAFPIFAFQIAEGFVRTTDRRRYAMRLALTALISEVPFDLVLTRSLFSPARQNTIFTLLLGLAVIWALDHMLKQRTFSSLLTAGSMYGLACCTAAVCRTDYSWAGVTIVAAFYLFRNFRFAWVFQFAVIFILRVLMSGGRLLTFSLLGMAFSFPLQGLAIFALPLIWLYNGEQGRGGRTFRLCSYVFYPAHLLLLYLVYRLLLFLLT